MIFFFDYSTIYFIDQWKTIQTDKLTLINRHNNWWWKLISDYILIYICKLKRARFTIIYIAAKDNLEWPGVQTLYKCARAFCGAIIYLHDDVPKRCANAIRDHCDVYIKFRGKDHTNIRTDTKLLLMNNNRLIVRLFHLYFYCVLYFHYAGQSKPIIKVDHVERPGLSQEEIAELREAFNLFDTDGGGK